MLNYFRELDIGAYRQIFFYEILLRRALRWELRGQRALGWMNDLGDVQAEIFDRINKARRVGSCNPDHSELSYLDLGELVDLVFRKYWREIFSPILRSQGLRETAHRSIIAVRNKVAHYRAIDQGDVQLLNSADELWRAFQRYYSMELKASAHISGQDAAADVALDAQEVSLLKEVLQTASVPGLWDEFGKLEGLRAIGLSPGMGVVKHHVFFELYTPLAFSTAQFVPLARQKQLEITFLHFGSEQEYVRLFLPLKMGEKTLRTLIRSLAAIAKQAVVDPAIPRGQADELDLGYWEHIGIAGKNMHFGFVF